MTAYAAMFGWSFLAATILPIGSEPALFALIRHGYPWPLVVTVATIGNYLGSCTTYWLGRQAGRALERRGWVRLTTEKAEAAEPTSLPAISASSAVERPQTPREQSAAKYVRHYGQPILIFSWVPVLGDALVAAAGAAAMPFVGFSCWVVTGKALRYLAVAWGALL